MLYILIIPCFFLTFCFFIIAERDIFGEALSDSDEEVGNINIMDMDEDMSHLTADDSRLSDTNSLTVYFFNKIKLKKYTLTYVFNSEFRKKNLQFLEIRSLLQNLPKKCSYLMIIPNMK